MTTIDNPSLSRLIMIITAVFILMNYGCALDDGADPKELTLDIYVDDTGKAFVTGYAEDIKGLSFLETSQYEYENDTDQLYAITNSLTWKEGDEWSIRFATEAYYDEYHTTFYLPTDVKLVKIDGSEDLEYLVSASNDSFVVEFYGYEVERPTTTISYQQPLLSVDADERSIYPPISAAVLILVLLAVIAAVTIRTRTKRETGPGQETVAQDRSTGGAKAEEEEEEEEKGEKIEITSEMAAVMETLTERERSVMDALIDHRGRMTQAEIRYEIGIPKSSLTGIIISLERRKIVTKKEWGRTNVIELSERFRPGRKED